MNSEQFYEVRTFQQRPSVVEAASGQTVFPVLFNAKVFDFYQRRKQISEETGYLLWNPELQMISQISIQPPNVFRLETAKVEQVQETTCLMFNSGSETGGALSAFDREQSDQQRAFELTVIFDAGTYRFDQTSSLRVSGQRNALYREVGELMRVGPWN